MSASHTLSTALGLGTSTPMRRLLAYYTLLALVAFGLSKVAPNVTALVTGDINRIADGATWLSEALPPAAVKGTPPAAPNPMTSLAAGLSTTLAFVSTLLLMLPVAWVYMSTAPGRKHNQSLVQTLIVLPMIVAGIVLVVQNSLALAFSLAGVVAAVRFRTNLSEARDVMFVLLAIAVGFAAGVHLVMAAVYLSVLFNLVLLLIWRYDFGRNILELDSAATWASPLATLSERTGEGYAVPDRELVLALTPKKVDVLSHRFERIRKRIGSNGKKPKYNAVVTVTATDIDEAQRSTEKALTRATKRWKLDEVVTNSGKPSEMYYLVRTRKSVPRDALLTEVRNCGNGCLAHVDIEVGDAIAVEQSELHAQKKLEQKALEQH